ncbi:MAG: NAD-binding protein [Xanthobacteraceae bacterium]
MDNPLLHPSRNLFRGTAFMAIVWVAATTGYMRGGWNFQDAFYMVTLTVFTVGYEEVRPIDTQFLHWLTMGTMAFGCTGMIFLSGALVQFMTLSPLQQILGGRRVQAEVDKLENHIIVCGYGRIGVELAKALKDGRAPYVVLEQNEQRVRHARDAGHSCLQGDATNEATLLDAGIARARALATVLPNDAANVFITLSARSLNSKIEIIARGDAVSTERKLVHAGANKVVLPTHIGAERIAEILLFPETSRFIRESQRMRELEKQLRNLGLVIEVVVAPEGGALTDLTIEEIESRTNSAFFIVQINRRDGDAITGPDKKTRVEAGDGVAVVGRSAQAINAMFAAPRNNGRSGRLR